MIKIIKSTDSVEFEGLVNDFETSHNVFATQTHILRNEGMLTVYVAVVFYKDKSSYNKS